MHIVIAPDSFKESLSAAEVTEIIHSAFLTKFPRATYSLLPLADGGEGTVDAILYSQPGQKIDIEVLDPLEQKIRATFALIDEGQTALIEIAAASGLPLLKTEQRDAKITTSYGTGQLIKAALDSGVSKIILGLGGSATNDSGAGILEALGARLLDKHGNTLPKGGIKLADFDTLELSNIDPRLKEIEFIVACDVQNPLCGANGASHIFGKQKGASFEERVLLDAALHNFATKTEFINPSITFEHASMGAAGGAPYGLSRIVPQLKIVNGIDFILKELGYDEVIKQADLVITGEGRMDNQTLSGKTPLGVAKLAKDNGIPVIGICGILGDEVEKLDDYFAVVFPILRSLKPLEKVLAEAKFNLYNTASAIASLLKISDKLR
ncbi:glycerate kinase [Thorsellia kenyensis]|uniref:Glycerate kinase n=1 Tax=Thorsellia kenyensis TaxID=1549888 RepID=A0ABV6C6Z0_9GAMM